MITFKDLFDSSNTSRKDEHRGMGGNFIKGNPQVRFTLYPRNISSFWNLIETNFTLNGAKAVIQTVEETYIITLKEGDEKYLKYSEVPYLKGRNVKIFDR